MLGAAMPFIASLVFSSLAMMLPASVAGARRACDRCGGAGGCVWAVTGGGAAMVSLVRRTGVTGEKSGLRAGVMDWPRAWVAPVRAAPFYVLASQGAAWIERRARRERRPDQAHDIKETARGDRARSAGGALRKARRCGRGW